LAGFEGVYHRQDKFEEQTQAALRRLELSRHPQFQDLRNEASALVGVGIGLKNWGRYQEAMTYLTQAEQLAERIQDIGVLSEALEMQTECWFRQDRWDEVLKTEGGLLDLQHRYGFARAGTICYFLGFNASVNALRGESERARELREEANEIMTIAAGGSEETWWRSQHY